MDEDHPLPSPKKLTTLVSAVLYTGGNSFLHKFVLDNSCPNPSENESYINLILLAISGVNVTAINDEGYTALHLAVLKGNLLMVRKLLSCLSDIDIDKGVQMSNVRHLQNALYLAAGLGHLPIVQELVKRGADVNIRYGHGNSPICRAAEQGHMDIVRFLFDRAIDVRMDDLLRGASSSSNLEFLQFLVNEKGADVNNAQIGPRMGMTPLHNAISSAAVEFLLGKGAKIHAQDDLRMTPLHQAVKNDNMDVTRCLLENGACVNHAHMSGWTPLHFAAFGVRPEIVIMLLERGAEKNHADMRGWTPLHIASATGCTEIAIILLDRGAEVNFTNSFGYTPLHVAASRGNAGTVVALLQRGADRNARNSSGRTPLDMAKDSVCIDILKQA